MSVAKRELKDTTVPPITVDFKTALKAMLDTPPPPAGDPSTRKQKAKKTKKTKA